jgi:hypothetical protein
MDFEKTLQRLLERDSTTKKRQLSKKKQKNNLVNILQLKLNTVFARILEHKI